MKKIVNRYRYSVILLKQLVKMDFKIRYQNSILGYIWTLLRPLFLFAVLYVVFVKILPVNKGIDHAGAYLLLGIVLWNYFVEVTTGSVAAVVAKGDMMRKVNFPRYVIVLAVSLSALINLFFNMIIVALFMFIAKTQISSSVVMFPLLILELFLFAGAISLTLSAMFVKYRDVGFIWEVAIQAGFFATPVMYSFSFIAAKSLVLGKILMLNPITQIMQDARYMLVTEKTDTIHSIFGSYWPYAITVGIVVLLSMVATVYFKKQAPYFAENV